MTQPDFIPVVRDQPTHENFKRQAEENRQLRTWLHLLFQAWIDTGLTIPAALQTAFTDAERKTR